MQHLRQRFLVALGAVAASSACKNEPPTAEPSASTSSGVAPVTASISPSTSAGPSSTTAPSTSASAPASTSAAPPVALPEPTSPFRRVSVSSTCVAPTEDTLKDPLPAPYAKCRRELERSKRRAILFSQRATDARREKKPEDCCYRVFDQVRIIKGRALRVDSTPHVAAATRRGDWAQRPSSPGEHLPELALSWREAGVTEHASIAAFARLQLQLLALGAPASLFAAAGAAAQDELEHARLCFGLAGRYGGSQVGPSSLPAAAAPLDCDLDHLIDETFVDGCVGETIAAVEARRGASLAEDAEVAATLTTIADDEERHAELAWRILSWALEQRPEAAERIDRVARNLRPVSQRRQPTSASMLNRHGLLSTAQLEKLAEQVQRDVVRPCLDALLARGKTRRASRDAPSSSSSDRLW